MLAEVVMFVMPVHKEHPHEQRAVKPGHEPVILHHPHVSMLSNSVQESRKLSKTESDSGPGVDKDEGEVLRRVTVRLPPPPPRSASRLPRAVRRAFGRLFEALGLQNCFEGDEELELDRTKVRLD